jgi:hypothetical protein
MHSVFPHPQHAHFFLSAAMNRLIPPVAIACRFAIMLAPYFERYRLSR